ncbi:ABC transporter substrate-binding protein [Chelatococcus reniformis]|uniref:Branched-chain amino acid ABC transporter substrate-binding protein n=1 Tax=Chelatococcus reniformis TaxID=1494448 RepID=A0A916UAD9_9HYPH|nr:ABC transporter substrate-binding protein [Chelatococcus reniformis]GGC64491.1 branched-chain amino acid ABC transporter substrate-binding protein [Chelatococcus reniformis]
MTMSIIRLVTAAALACAASAATAQVKKYDEGASDTEVKLGQTMPYSGPLSAHGIQGRSEVAYFKMLNETQGGINGRKINLISLDDAFSPPKTVEQTRKLVEQDGVLALFGSSGTAAQSAVQKYLNGKKIPQVLLSTGANKWNQPKLFPWSTPAFFLYGTEGEVLGRYVMKVKPDAKIAILYQNDDFGKDYVAGFKKALGDKASTMIIKEVTYELSDPTLDSQVLALKNSDADVFFNVSLGKATSQVYKKVYELNWKPLQLVVSPSTGRVFLEAAGLETVNGIIGATAYKQFTSPRWANDPDVIAYKEFQKKYLPNDDPMNEIGFVTYSFAHVMAHIIRASGDDLTRANLLKQAINLKNVPAPALLPGTTYNTTPDDYVPFKRMQVQRFDGNDWVPLEDITAE